MGTRYRQVAVRRKPSWVPPSGSRNLDIATAPIITLAISRQLSPELELESKHPAVIFHGRVRLFQIPSEKP
jgi:hypothetical protein